jgi:hypothetical protein
MRINLIGNFTPNTGLSQDALLLRGIFTNIYGDKVHFFKVPYQHPQCQEAELNIFIEVMNPSLISYAQKNIWIPNLEWTYKTWIPYCKLMDEIWTKTSEATTIFKMLCEGTSTKVHNICWSSIAKSLAEKKNYSKAIVLVGKNIFRNPKQLFKAYQEIKEKDSSLYKKLPELYVPYNPQYVTLFCPDSLNDKITLLSKHLSDKEYDDLLNECGLAICLSAAEGFGHAVNEAMSSGCNLLLSNIQPFQELSCDSTLRVNISNSVDLPDRLGTICDTSVISIIQNLKEYVSREFKSKKLASELSRNKYEEIHSKFVNFMNDFLPSKFIDNEYILKNTLPKEEDLPDISIVTLTKDRREFMSLANYCYLIQSYPEDKIEWIIVDDGEDSIEDTLIGIPNVKYIRCDKPMTIGEKRNLGVESAMYDYICMMDDDDVYPENSILFRITMLLKEPLRECVFCTTIPCYDITKFTSFMNVPPITLKMSERVSEATLCFTKKFWEERKFDDIQIAEGNTFVQGREHMCRELSPQDVIVSLVHTKNSSSRKTPKLAEPNGCHYGFNEKLFTLVTEIGNKLKGELA